MARSQQKKGLDQQGQIPRQLGWKLNGAGKRVQHKFRLGSDPKEAARREQRLCEFWELVERHADGPAYWDDFTLNTAKSIAKGIIPIPVFRLEDESELEYANRVKRIQLDFPVRPELHRGTEALLPVASPVEALRLEKTRRL